MEKIRSTGTSVEKESYIVGQVADSLFQKPVAQSSTTLLSTLFTTPPSAAQPVFTPVPEHKVSGEKRKVDQDDGANKAQQQQPKKKKPAREKPCTAAQRKLAERESALNAADQEGEGGPRGKRKRSKKGLGGEPPVTPELPSEKAASADTKKSPANPALERMKNKRTLFVGNLPSDCSKQMITALFKEFGPIESVRFRSVARAEPNISRKLATIQRKVHPKRNNMNVYIVFKKNSDAVKALRRNGCQIKAGFHIRVDLASKSNTHDHRRSIFLGNLSYEIREDEVRDHFRECGAIESVRIVRDRESGMGKGFGYVLFQSTDAVTLALKLSESTLKGRKVRVSHSVRSPREPAGKDRVMNPGKPRQPVEKPPVKGFTGTMAKPTVEKKKMKKKGQKSKPNQRKGRQA
ncbi:RNA-binding protein 34 [Heptranchias perlo]|uniref:RNA-binding protein 34 n=1 Tax=Heptranchias perlo TaxID=212740 RepID=UPI0035594184